jgi:hypothetical protein
VALLPLVLPLPPLCRLRQRRDGRAERRRDPAHSAPGRIGFAPLDQGERARRDPGLRREAFLAESALLAQGADRLSQLGPCTDPKGTANASQA